MKKRQAHRNLNRKINKAVNRAIYELLHPQVEIVGPIPQYASELSAGADIAANLWKANEKFLKNAEVQKDDEGNITGILLHAGGKCLIPTGIYTAFPGLYEAQIRSRSGNALKFEIVVLNSPGTIEGDYKNEWGVIIKNLSEEDFLISDHDRIAQVVFALKCNPRWVVRNSPEELSGSDRGGGFGHSGK